MQQIKANNLKLLRQLLAPHKPTIIIGHKGTGKNKLAEYLGNQMNKPVIYEEPVDNLDEAIELDMAKITSPALGAQQPIYVNSMIVEALAGHFEKVHSESENIDVKKTSEILGKIFSKANIIYSIADEKFVLSNLLAYGHKQDERIFTNFEEKIKAYGIVFYTLAAKHYTGYIINYNNIYAKHKNK